MEDKSNTINPLINQFTELTSYLKILNSVCDSLECGPLELEGVIKDKLLASESQLVTKKELVELNDEIQSVRASIEDARYAANDAVDRAEDASSYACTAEDDIGHLSCDLDDFIARYVKVELKNGVQKAEAKKAPAMKTPA